MNYLLSDIKKYYDGLDHKRRLQIIILVVLLLSLVITVIFLAATASKVTRSNIDVIYMKQKNDELIRNNKDLIKSVQSLNSLIESETIKDSIRDITIQRNSSYLPILTDKLSQINKQYENTNRTRNFSVIDAEQYIANEARRIRQSASEERDPR